MRFELDERVQHAPPRTSALGGHRGRLVLDLGIAVALAVVACLYRRGGLPEDGLWFDDSWVAAGAIEGSLATLAGLARAGFERTVRRQFDWAVVDTWERVDGSAE